MAICDDLRSSMITARAKLATDEQSYSNACSQYLLDAANALNNDPNHPSPMDYTTIPPYLEQLQFRQPPATNLIAIYRAMMIDLTNIGGLSVMVNDDNTSIAAIQAQLDANGC
jgi:hypothetical protein